ncbi:glycoside hydrolase family 70 protein, partial [Limosilactobacillus caviae]|uniref:glycoside hydrolase family 70 protein n=2 Tax=Limosilactobacillus caviae TaxID=1769424 RepID=UPI003D195C27
GNFDYVKVNGNQVEFSGWHASDQAFNMPYQWLIVLSNGKEVGRQLISTTKDGVAGFNRNDVYNAFPEIAGSVQSGFQGSMTLKNSLNNTSVQLVHRFSDDGKNGEGNRIDFWSTSLPVKDGFQLGKGPLHKFGLQTINGKQYFVDTVTNQPRKNFLLQDGDNWLYFDSVTGAAQNALKLQFDKGTVSFDAAFINGNQAYSYDNNSIENVNGFLTADTWYRPKQILKDGTTWTNTKENDLRPLLMVWWPNRQIQVDYLNYMKKNGLINTNGNFSVNEDNTTLSKATEDVQRNIEKRINNENSSEWLKVMINEFIKTESIWNKSSESEDYGGLQLQGGFLKYVNSDLTKYANSDWRLMDRTATNINGKGYGGAEFLLANDIDNSNPVVQAEELNWLYYLMNFGTITGNNSEANFDGIRVDAVDNVDVDLLSIARNYFNAAYNMEQSDANANKHLNILEDWGWDDPAYVNQIGNPQLTMDDRFRNAIMDTLSGSPENNQGLSKLITQALVNRANDSTENAVIPSYTFVRAHDSNAQDQIRQAIQAATGKPYGQFNLEDEKKGMDLYIKDQNSTNKKWNLYNMPSAYTVLLTSKDTVPRVYYGDLYQDGGQYMEHQTRYYPTITNLLKTRIKYVAGGQTMNVDNNGVLTSVRFGKGAMTVNDAGNTETRTEGIGVVISNDTNLALKDSDSVVLHMGAAHKNQKYRAVILTTQDGVKNYESDENAPIAYTDANGDLRFFNRDLTISGAGTQANTAVKGYANPDVTGYLAVWVPADAPADQDARTIASDEAHTTKTAYRSNAALDSNVIYEGFSNFIYWPTTKDERTNVRIAQNADLFKSWGITSFEMAPQYNSSKDGTFLDSIIDNGYAFTDRYDLGMSTPNKYGSDEDLRNALQSLHKAGLQAIADWVPDQIYNLPGKEAVTVIRSDDHGNTWENSTIKNTVYVVNTIGGGEYQKKYGGAFLDDLQKQYPDLFKQKYATTGTTIDPSVKITEWSAKYLNGTNILHRGSGYVLRSNDGQYYNLGTSTKQFLPSQLMGKGEANENSFVMSTDGKYHYYNENGEMVKNTFIQDSTGNWYFFDNKGDMVANKNFVEVNSNGTSGTYLFLNNGVSFRSGLVKTTDGTYYFDGDGRMVRNQVVKAGAMTYVLDQTGKLISESYDPSATEAHPLKPGDLSGQN